MNMRWAIARPSGCRCKNRAAAGSSLLDRFRNGRRLMLRRRSLIALAFLCLALLCGMAAALGTSAPARADTTQCPWLDASKTPDQRAQMLAAPGFGSVFTDHIAKIRWTHDRGWHDARIDPPPHGRPLPMLANAAGSLPRAALGRSPGSARRRRRSSSKAGRSASIAGKLFGAWRVAQMGRTAGARRARTATRFMIPRREAASGGRLVALPAMSAVLPIAARQRTSSNVRDAPQPEMTF